MFLFPLFAALAAETAPVPENVPEMMVTEAGEPVKTVETWENVRRGEIFRFFERQVFGRRPVERPPHLTFTPEGPDKVMMDGAAVRKRVRIEYGGEYGTNSFAVTAFVPTAAKTPAPAFVLICNRDPKENADPERIRRSGFWPAEEIVRRGFAAVAFYNGDLAPDFDHGNRLGAFAAFRDVSRGKSRDSWGALSCWAWGASRVMDWIETEPYIDAKRVAVVGHSRGGKASLLTAVTDRRFALACVNDSGGNGAKLRHIDLPKSSGIAYAISYAGYWFCSDYAYWANREKEMPYDHHEWLALVAPRLLCVASASEDAWAGPEGEYWGARLASPAWELYGKKGLVTDGFPAPDTPQQEGCVSYHLRAGQHDLTPYDWGVYMDFAKRHGW